MDSHLCLEILLNLNYIHLFPLHTDDMESVGNGWRDELRKYFRSVENLTEKALQLIKCDRIRNNLPFDESFKKYFLERTSFR